MFGGWIKYGDCCGEEGWFDFLNFWGFGVFGKMLYLVDFVLDFGDFFEVFVDVCIELKEDDWDFFWGGWFYCVDVVELCEFFFEWDGDELFDFFWWSVGEDGCYDYGCYGDVWVLVFWYCVIGYDVGDYC